MPSSYLGKGGSEGRNEGHGDRSVGQGGMDVKSEVQQQSWPQGKEGNKIRCSREAPAEGICLSKQEPVKLGASEISVPLSYLLGLSPCDCNDTANPFHKLALADDGQVLHSSCLEKVPAKLTENRKETSCSLGPEIREPTSISDIS